MEAFDLTYKDQLRELAEINLTERARVLKLEMRSDSLVIPFFGRQHFISAPTPAVATVLLNYTLRNTMIPPANPEKISFREFKGAGPLVVSFANNTHHLIASTFAGRLEDLGVACRNLFGILGIAVVALHKLERLHEHTARTAAGVVDLALVGLDHFRDQIDHTLGCIELAPQLALGGGKLAEEIFINPARPPPCPGSCRYC